MFVCESALFALKALFVASIEKQFWCKIAITKFHSYIVNNQQFDTLFIIRGNLNAHAPTLALICDFFHPIIIVLYYTDISIPPMSLFILIVFVTFVSYGYTFCRASKDQSETGSLITIPCFSSRIILVRVGIAPAIFAHLYLFFADYREHTTHHLHYNLSTYFPVLFIIAFFFQCVQSGHMLHENILYKDSLQFMHDLPSSLPKESISCSLT